MMEALIAATLVASLSLIGVLFFGQGTGSSASTHRFVLPTAVGVFLGVVFFELIPETIEASRTWGPACIAMGFIGFYFLSHLLESYHHHHQDNADACAHEKGARMLLVGDAVHNLADGIVVATAFMINPVIGALTTIGIALHEVPQEIAEFGVLMQAGYGRRKAALYNLLSALAIVIGVVLTYAFASTLGSYLYVLTGIAAGNLLYIAAADLIPELRHSHREHFGKTFMATLLGLILISALIMATHEYFGENEHERFEETAHTPNMMRAA